MTLTARAGALLAAATAAAAAAPAAARHPPPRLAAVRCVPPRAPGCATLPTVKIGARLQLSGRGLYGGMRVTFRWPRGALATKMRRTRIGFVVRVPAGVRAGPVWVRVRDRALRFSNARRVRVVAPPPPPPSSPAAPGALPAVFTGAGMWIWQLSRSEGGDPAAIAARARAAGLSTVFVKSADGANVWSQFSPALVAALHAQGLRVCAWQFVYGADPNGEASAAAAGPAAGADCFVIDAETRYEGRYAAAQTYLAALRAAVGPSYPLGLTSFPYVDYHPGLPFSVFLGPGGAQANLPQVYWKAIGGGVDAVSARTWAQNRVYAVPVAPLGQAYDDPAPADIARFRQLWAAYGAGGLSWWSWQAASEQTWTAIGAPPPPATAVPDPGWPLLRLKSRGDQVIWLQQHLSSEDPTVPVDGVFADSTDQALRGFQTRRGLPATGETDAATWQALLALPVRAVDWGAQSPGFRSRTARPAEVPVLGAGPGPRVASTR